MAKNFYELTYVVNPVLEEDDLKNVQKRVEDLLTKHKAEVDHKDEWGIQRLAYEIDGKNSGYFVNMYFEVDGTIIPELERLFQLEDNIIRYLTIKYDNKMKRHYKQWKKGELPEIFPKVEEEEEIEDPPVPVETVEES